MTAGICYPPIAICKWLQEATLCIGSTMNPACYFQMSKCSIGNVAVVVHVPENKLCPSILKHLGNARFVQPALFQKEKLKCTRQCRRVSMRTFVRTVFWGIWEGAGPLSRADGLCIPYSNSFSGHCNESLTRQCGKNSHSWLLLRQHGYYQLHHSVVYSRRHENR